MVYPDAAFILTIILGIEGSSGMPLAEDGHIRRVVPKPTSRIANHHVVRIRWARLVKIDLT